MSEVEKVEKVEKKKEKKVLTPERLEQLAKARHRALQIRQAGASLKQEQKEMADAALEEKLERERQLNDAVKKSLIPNTIDHSLLPVPRYTNTIIPNLIEEEEEEEEQPVIIKKKTKKPPKTKVIIEQSSDDEDEFQSNDHVIFVKRKSKNDSIKKVPATTPVPPNTPEPYYDPPPIQRQNAMTRPQPEFTNFVDLMANNGGFVNRRKYY
jgi:hypothetical protein